MRELLIIRHAKAEKNPPGIVRDIDRPLTRQGFSDAFRLGRFLASVGYHSDLVLCSPSLRTRQTHEALAKGGFSWGSYQESMVIYEGHTRDIEQLCHMGESNADRMTIIGHNPSLEEWVWHLCGINDSALHLKPCAAICHRWPDGLIHWYLSPSFLPKFDESFDDAE
jgi:phosphohistidine phosphatase